MPKPPATPESVKSGWSAERRTLDTAASDLASTHPHIDAAIQRLRDQQRGHPGSGLGSTGRSGTSTSPVEAALGLTGTGPAVLTGDPAAALLRELDDLTKRIGRDTARLRQIVQGNTPHAPSDRDRAAVDGDNTAHLECKHCRTHAEMFEPYRTITDVGGVLPAPVPLCRWHTDFTARVGRPATKQETQRHARGQKVRVPV